MAPGPRVKADPVAVVVVGLLTAAEEAAGVAPADVVAVPVAGVVREDTNLN